MTAARAGAVESVHSVKGGLLVGAVVSVKRLRDAGRITAGALAARLSPQALALVDQKIEIARWYPVRAFCELLDVDWEVASHRLPAYMERQGAASADRMFDSKMYQQLEFAERSGKVSTRDSLVRQSKLITTITGAFYDFITTRVEIAQDALSIVYGNALAFEEPLVHTTVGFMNQINQRQGSKRGWTSKRVRPDEVHFLMSLPERFTASS
jgi:hypothetical protein